MQPNEIYCILKKTLKFAVRSNMTGVGKMHIIQLGYSNSISFRSQKHGICERFHKTILQEFYQVAFRKRIYRDIDSLQADLDQWLDTKIEKLDQTLDQASVNES